MGRCLGRNKRFGRGVLRGEGMSDELVEIESEQIQGS